MSRVSSNYVSGQSNPCTVRIDEAEKRKWHCVEIENRNNFIVRKRKVNFAQTNQLLLQFMLQQPTYTME